MRELLADDGLDVSYSTLTRWVREAELRGPPRRAGEYNFAPGQEMQHDTSPRARANYSTLSRRAKTLEGPPLHRTSSGPLHLLVDSTGLKLGGAGEWLVEKHGTSRRRSWRKLHIGVDAGTGQNRRGRV